MVLKTVNDILPIEPVLTSSEEISSIYDAKSAKTHIAYTDGPIYVTLDITHEFIMDFVSGNDLWAVAASLLRKKKAMAIEKAGGLEKAKEVAEAWKVKQQVQENAINSREVRDILEKMFPNFPWHRQAVHCPEDCLHSQQVEEDGKIFRTLYTGMSIIIHLNDTHMWTREQIADWLEESDFDIQSEVRREDVNT